LRALFRGQSGGGNDPMNTASSLAVGMSLGAPSLDPFCKTSFDTLLDSAIEAIEGDSHGFMLPEGHQQSGQQQHTFPGFQGHAPSTTQQHDQHQQLYLAQMGQIANMLKQVI